jgi:hypothetical protein
MLKFVQSNQPNADNELEIAFDEAGAALLISTVEKVLKSMDHEHVSENPLGRYGLTIARDTDSPIKLVSFRFDSDG